MADRPLVVIATPSWRVAPFECQDYRVGLAHQLGIWEAQPDCPWRFAFWHATDMLVQMTRELLAQKAVEEGAEYLGMIDDDMLGYVVAGNYENVWTRLLANHPCDIVSALAFTRGKPHTPVCYTLRGGWDKETGRNGQKTVPILTYPVGQLFECDAVGFGAVLVNVRVFREIPRPWFMSSSPTGEDILFCLKARQHGFRVWCDATTRLKHQAPRTYIGEEEYFATRPDVHAMREQFGEWTPERSAANLPA